MNIAQTAPETVRTSVSCLSIIPFLDWAACKCSLFFFPRSPFAIRLLLLLPAFLAGCSPLAASTIPVLCYHQVIPKPTGQFQISSADFRDQIARMKALGFTTINSKTFLKAVQNREEFVRKVALITFDDGFRGVYDYAFPIMKEFGFVGVVCVYPRFIDSPGGLSWAMIREMIDGGWSVECHSLSHADLWKTPSDPGEKKAFLQREIAEARKIIREKTREPVDFMVWPYGIYTEETEKIAVEAGYSGAFTVDGGGNSHSIDPFRVKRQVVYRTDSPEKFVIRLEMGYLEVGAASPRPGEVLSRLTTMKCTLPTLVDYSPQNYVLNAKVTGGTIDFAFDPATRQLTGNVHGNLRRGQHFIDIYVRDLRTGTTSQCGWLFTID